MLTLVTTNPSKYEPFAKDLERLRIDLVAPKHDVPELQSLNFSEALAHKAQEMARMFGRSVLVDDAGLILEAYQPFPGPLTSVILRSLGHPGLRRLLQGVSDRAAMECHLGWWAGGQLRSWTGKVSGRLDLSRSPANARMLLTDLFVPDQPCIPDVLPHRARALAELESAVFGLHLETAVEPAGEELSCSPQPAHLCPFCAELEGGGSSIFAEMMAGRLASRVVYEDDDFVLMPPLGQFIEGGLLLLTRQHVLSFAHLSAPLYERLERLLTVLGRELAARYGTAPLVFEHGPALQRSKGVCCVDHAHLNIFPARVPVHPHLSQRMHMPIGCLSELSGLRSAEFGYLFVQENDGSRKAYDAHLVPTQLVRRMITSQLGQPGRWHWQDYPGFDELVATYHSLKGKIRL
jgi:inosine/xanthosine triphosphate pyrophosphatase family protein/diadenosine tetraphosphate (Ap4A) HIT family hydrolase